MTLELTSQQHGDIESALADHIDIIAREIGDDPRLSTVMRQRGAAHKQRLESLRDLLAKTTTITLHQP